MDDKVITSAEELQELISDYRRRIANDKKLYEYYHRLYWPWRPEAWEAVDEALKTQARYWRGEIVRAKHNLARYMRGEDLQLQRKYFVHTTQDTWLHDALERLQNAIEIEEDPNRPKIMGALDRDYFLMCCESMKRDAEYTRRFIYAG